MPEPPFRWGIQMFDCATILFITIFLVVLIGTFSVFVVVAIFVARSWMQSTRAAMNQLAERFDLVNHGAEGALPELRGSVEGVEIVVDVVYQNYARMGSPIKSSVRAWTRVQAQVPKELPLQIRSRHQQVDDQTNVDWQIRKTGNAAFDQKYELRMADNVAVDSALPIDAKDALIAANPPVHVSNGKATWTQVKFVRDFQLLQNAVLSCAHVAAAFATQSNNTA